MFGTQKYLEPNLPLVSVVAVSYNQASLITETLDSIYKQDYQNIELIICDDGSTDETVNIASNWIEQNRDRFVAIHLVTNESNVGVCANFARGYSKVRGRWIKPLACDDILEPFAISIFVQVAIETGRELLFSQMSMFTVIDGTKKFTGKFLTNFHKINLLKNQLQTVKELTRQNFLPAPSAFLSINAYSKSGGIDPRFRHLEDWPLWLNICNSGFSIQWIPETLVKYRISDQSVSQSKNTRPISPVLYPDIIRFYYFYQKPYLRGLQLFERQIYIFRTRMVFEKMGNSWFAYILLKPFQLLSPLTWIKALRKFI